MIINNISIPKNTCRKTTFLTQGDISVLVIGRGSCIVNASVQCGMPINFHIGQFCSIGKNVNFVFANHSNFTRVSTSNDELVAVFPSVLIQNKTAIKSQILIKNDVLIGDNVNIYSGVTIGNGAVILDNTVVTSDIPPYAIVGGNPAKVIEYRFTEEQIRDLQNIVWWNWTDKEMIERKPDFSLPIQEFINKYKVTNSEIDKANNDIKRILLIPDFDVVSPLWKRVVGEYCDACQEGRNLGQLYIYIPENEKTNQCISMLENFLTENYDGSGDVYVQVGQIQDEKELFEISDYFVTCRNLETVYYSCLADKYGVNIISGADLPYIFSL